MYKEILNMNMQFKCNRFSSQEIKPVFCLTPFGPSRFLGRTGHCAED